ncbi:MAG: sulfite exporter TauE/SafE family protein [Chitinivibrionales bacterium]|nr:sulfite exporter TauE/SafE family protein [Chitinivibrionales bacterium]
MNATAVLCLIGITAGLTSGFFGIGGGIIIIPALVYFAGYSQTGAIGTSLAILLPPVGLMATIEYYRHGQVNLRAALIIAACLFVTAWISSIFAVKLPQTTLKFMFGVFITVIGVYITVTSGIVLFK